MVQYVGMNGAEWMQGAGARAAYCWAFTYSNLRTLPCKKQVNSQQNADKDCQNRQYDRKSSRWMKAF